MTYLTQTELSLDMEHADAQSHRQARLSTLDQDLKLEGPQFGTAISILSGGYVQASRPARHMILSDG